jgi:predicted nuclease with TOPRIM domain
MRFWGRGEYPRRREPTRSDGQTSVLQRENARLRDTNRQLLQQVNSLQSRLDDMEQSLVSQEAQIVRAQAYVFENVNSDTWALGDDNTIRAEIEQLQSRIKSWAKKNAIDEMSSLERLDSEESAAFLDLLAQVARFDKTDLSHPQRALAHLTTTLMNKKSPMMCLQALLAYHVYSSIIERPFFALDSDDGTLQSVYRKLKRGNGQ